MAVGMHDTKLPTVGMRWADALRLAEGLIGANSNPQPEPSYERMISSYQVSDHRTANPSGESDSEDSSLYTRRATLSPAFAIRYSSLAVGRDSTAQAGAMHIKGTFLASAGRRGSVGLYRCLHVKRRAQSSQLSGNTRQEFAER